MYKYVSYISEQSHILTEAEIIELLNASRRNNAQNNITGILIYFNGIFTQFFEGPEEAVDGLYTKIIADRRHRNIKELFCGYHPKRFYKDWEMAFRSLKEEELPKILGYRKLDRANLFANEEAVDHFGVNMLKNFVEGLHMDQ